MNSHCEELYLEAELAIKNSEFITAKRHYEEILQDEPTCACAHNSLGWLYKSQFDDYTKAEAHYNAAIRYEPSYPHAYWNLAYLLTETERWEDLRKLMQLSLSIPSLDKMNVYHRLAIMEEITGNLSAARDNYIKSIFLCIHNEKIDEFKKDVERCEYKIALKEG